MKDGKKRQGTKARVQASKKRLARIGTTITIAVLVTIVAVSGFLVYSYLNSSPDQTVNTDQTSNQPSEPKAAIIDHLSLSAPNQTFIQTATNTLKQAGYTVDYYPGEEVKVELYRNLPTNRYSLIVFRVHSTYNDILQSVALFTSEPYSKTKYVHEQLTGQAIKVAFREEESTTYFAITPQFVKQSMKDRFQNTTIIMMGCDGLRYTAMAEAFVERGAKVYISWDGEVLASHTDRATTQLLQHLTIEKQTIKQAVTETMKEVGLDPAHKSQLFYCPYGVGNDTVEEITSEN